MFGKARRRVQGLLLATIACCSMGCVRQPHIRITETPEGKALNLTAKSERCSLLITRRVVAKDSEVIARLSYNAVNAGRRQAEAALRREACKLGADALLIEREDYGTAYGAEVEVLALALVYGPTATASAESEDGDADATGETTGTCFAASPDGHIVTAEHVIHDAKSIEVQFEGEEPISAALLERRPSVDIAILKVERKAPEFLPLQVSSAFKAGDRIFTFGFPVVELLGKEPKYTDGAISGLDGFQEARNLMQITVPIQPGNSGGPIVTENGYAIGVVVSSASVIPFLKATGALPQGLNWAVKSEHAMALLEPPDEEAPPVDRTAAVARARKAVCAVTASR